ncbi:metal ABC transporter solute-binding protein, Zn/Mn family [Ichthyobacterium seriolicida]|uniref:Manganese ABC transporter, periplasmic-binding protein SitA n=1 Tax=Ichthyobacterium seriolicida TaxID=242600 RepID=A0A1J1E2I2_9FLAO|nr:zinc ABC transporter substrate-binding protein [Ichthyobacterium seriolicida]BAV94244.1 manganese ABC transporter, periplasmic-binding protein SitA [Ichthyobacterium seriolicida]
MKKLLKSFMASILFISCVDGSKKGDISYIVCTTGMVEDIVKNIVIDKIPVESLMKSGVDPHLYKPTQGDIKKIIKADIIFYNGLHLEGKMTGILENLSDKKKIVAVSEALDKSDLINDTDFIGAEDPHIWNNVSNWIKATDYLRDILIELDEKNKDFYIENASVYVKKLEDLHLYIKNSIASIPQNRRVLITSHDAFSYYGIAYGLETKGLQGISTASEFGLKDVVNMVDFIIERGIKAIFVEDSVSSKSLKAVVDGCKSKGYEVEIGASLFSDAMGVEGTPESTYIGMLTHNTDQIVKALK